MGQPTSATRRDRPAAENEVYENENENDNDKKGWHRRQYLRAEAASPLDERAALAHLNAHDSKGL